MEIIVKKLVFKEISEEDLRKRCSPNTLKDTNLEWNREDNKLHNFAEDIENNDIVISIRDDQKGKDDYMYFFFTVKESPEKVNEGEEKPRFYYLNKVVIDSDLPENYIKESVQNVLKLLNNGVSIRLDRLYINNNDRYPFYKEHLNRAINIVSEAIIREFKTQKTGMAQFPPEFEEKLSNIAEKIKNAPE